MFKQMLPGWLAELTGRDNFWVLEIFLMVLLTSAAALIARIFLRRIENKTKHTKTVWDDALVGAARRPIVWFVWTIGLSSAAQVAAPNSDVFVLQHVDTIRYLAVIGILTWFITGLISRAEHNLTDPTYCHKPLDRTTALAVGKLLRISTLITALLVALQTLGFSISGVLAFGGIGGIAVGFAAKDLLANFFGGLMIYLDRPFKVGDWIRSPDKNIEGTVEDIGWRLTRIRTFDKRPLYVPNATFAQIAVENPSRMLNRRIYETVGIRYNDATKMAEVVARVKAMILQHPDIDTTQTIIVNFNGFAASSLDFFVYCFTKTTNWVEFHEIKQDVLLKILAIVEDVGAECAFPTSTIHLPDMITTEISSSKAPVVSQVKNEKSL